MKITFSIIIPVFNRLDEIRELLESLTRQTYANPYEVIVVDDGSKHPLKENVEKFSKLLNIKYFYKENSGPGTSRNFGMDKALGNYFLILDSDCILPENYLSVVDAHLNSNYSDAFGGPDTAHPSFTTLQKAINYSMTAFLTTGGLRTGRSTSKYQLRSYNMGLSKKAYDITGGFGPMRIGEDIDLTFRLWNNDLRTQCIPQAFVYHKRRSTVSQFYEQTHAFGKARPGLNRNYPGSARLTFWFPTLFLIGLILATMAAVFSYYQLALLYGLYMLLIAVDASLRNRSLGVGLYSILTTLTQFTGYGIGFVKGILLR